MYNIELGSQVPVKVGGFTLIGTAVPFVELYAQVTFSDGKLTANGIFGIGYVASIKDVSDTGGTVPGQYHFKINTTNYYYDVEFV